MNLLLRKVNLEYTHQYVCYPLPDKKNPLYYLLFLTLGKDISDFKCNMVYTQDKFFLINLYYFSDSFQLKNEFFQCKYVNKPRKIHLFNLLKK
jgi:hypothetical protein